MLAAVGTGAYETVEAAAGQLVHVVDTIEPDAKIAARYEEKYRQFQQIYPALKPVFPALHTVQVRSKAEAAYVL